MLRQCKAPAAAFLVAFAFQLPFFDRWFSFMDEGHLLLYADLIAQGGERYRDATVYPLPGAFWPLAAAFPLFGASNLVARWILVVEFALFAALVFALFRRIAGPRLAWLALAAFAAATAIAVRTAPAGARTLLGLPVDVPAGAHLRTAVSVHPEAWFGHPSSWIRFEVAIEAEGARTVIFERTLRPTSQLADRGWFEVDAPLERWAGRRVRLELSTAAQNATGASLAHGGFAEPRLVAPGAVGGELAGRP